MNANALLILNFQNVFIAYFKTRKNVYPMLIWFKMDTIGGVTVSKQD